MAFYFLKGRITVPGNRRYRLPLAYANGSRASIEIRRRKWSFRELVTREIHTEYDVIGILWITRPKRQWVLSPHEAFEIVRQAAKDDFDAAFDEFKDAPEIPQMSSARRQRILDRLMGRS